MTTSPDGVVHFTNHHSARLSEIIHETLSFNKDEFYDLLKLGAIYVQNERQSKDKLISEQSLIRIHTKPRRYNCDFIWSSRIVFENDFCLVLDKPSGIPSHPTVDNAIENAMTQTSLARKYPLFITHRLDTLTSGLIVYAKKTSFAKSFNLQLQTRSIRKNYVALVESIQIFPTHLSHFMNPDAGTPKKLIDDPREGWLRCELEILEQRNISPDLTWVKINLLTGRTHQIRSQFAHLRAPIWGDALYGSGQTFHPNAIALKSYEIEFKCNEETLKFNLSPSF